MRKLLKVASTFALILLHNYALPMAVEGWSEEGWSNTEITFGTALFTCALFINWLLLMFTLSKKEG